LQVSREKDCTNYGKMALKLLEQGGDTAQAIKKEDIGTNFGANFLRPRVATCLIFASRSKINTTQTMYVQCNLEAPSRNHCWRGKSTSTAYS